MMMMIEEISPLKMQENTNKVYREMNKTAQDNKMKIESIKIQTEGILEIKFWEKNENRSYRGHL